jgi:hypothetical protein
VAFIHVFNLAVAAFEHGNATKHVVWAADRRRASSDRKSSGSNSSLTPKQSTQPPQKKTKHFCAKLASKAYSYFIDERINRQEEFAVADVRQTM